MFSQKKVAIKNCERIRSSKFNSLLSTSYNSAVNESFDWITKIKQFLAEIGMFNYFANRDIFAFRPKSLVLQSRQQTKNIQSN